VAFELCEVAEVPSYPLPEEATETTVPELEEHRIFSSDEVPRSMTTMKFAPGEPPGHPVAAEMEKDVSEFPIAEASVVEAPPPA
jgi:hypothetical protein